MCLLKWFKFLFEKPDNGGGTIITVTVGDANKPTEPIINDDRVQWVCYGGGGSGTASPTLEKESTVKGGAGGPGIVGMLDKNGVFHKIDIAAWNYALKDCK